MVCCLPVRLASEMSCDGPCSSSTPRARSCTAGTCPIHPAYRPPTKYLPRYAIHQRYHRRTLRGGTRSMRGTMMDFPLTLQLVFERGTRLFPEREIVTGGLGGGHRYTYAEFGERVHRLANALKAMGIKPGDRVGTYAW